jgi:hypothetical protein
MVFLIQNSQNRDAAAIQAKLDEIIRAIGGARNEFIGIEHLTDSEIEEIRARLELEVQTSGSGLHPTENRPAAAQKAVTSHRWLERRTGALFFLGNPLRKLGKHFGAMPTTWPGTLERPAPSEQEGRAFSAIELTALAARDFLEGGPRHVARVASVCARAVGFDRR